MSKLYVEFAVWTISLTYINVYIDGYVHACKNNHFNESNLLTLNKCWLKLFVVNMNVNFGMFS